MQNRETRGKVFSDRAAELRRRDRAVKRFVGAMNAVILWIFLFFGAVLVLLTLRALFGIRFHSAWTAVLVAFSIVLPLFFAARALRGRMDGSRLSALHASARPQTGFLFASGVLFAELLFWIFTYSAGNYFVTPRIRTGFLLVACAAGIAGFVFPIRKNRVRRGGVLFLLAGCFSLVGMVLLAVAQRNTPRYFSFSRPVYAGADLPGCDAFDLSRRIPSDAKDLHVGGFSGRLASSVQWRARCSHTAWLDLLHTRGLNAYMNSLESPDFPMTPTEVLRRLGKTGLSSMPRDFLFASALRADGSGDFWLYEPNGGLLYGSSMLQHAPGALSDAP